MTIDQTRVRSAMQHFMDAQYVKKAEPLEKKREKANEAERQAIAQELADLREKYTVSNWLTDDGKRFAQQLKFGTHISKGIHPDSKGDNVNFARSGRELPEGLCGSQCVPETHYLLDANGNAAALPLAGFLASDVSEGVLLRDLLLANHPALSGAFADDPALSDQYQQLFTQVLRGESETAQTHERNKQLLWPNGDKAIVEDDYTVVIPLHPSALSHYVYRQISEQRWSEAAKAAGKLYFEMRQETPDKARKKLAEYREEHGKLPVSVRFSDLARMTLGGTKPQNISQLNSQQGGRQMLLPSLPPQYQAPEAHLRTGDRSFFNTRLIYQCAEPRERLAAVVESWRNIAPFRRQRERALDGFLHIIWQIAQDYRNQPAGWSEAFSHLPEAERFWLDPQHPRFVETESVPGNWGNAIAQSFSHWLQNWLKKRFKDRQHDFNDAEYQEWLKTFARALTAQGALR